MEGQMNILDFLPLPRSEQPAATICQYSGHTCNKIELWKVADALDDAECPHVCCRMCPARMCGARCNGSTEPRREKE